MSLIGQSVLEENTFPNGGNIHVFSPGTGADNSLGSNIFINTSIQSIQSFVVSFPNLRHCNSFPHSNV